MAAPEAERTEFLILGPLEARRGGEPLDLRGEKQRSLLAALLLNANRVVPVERLIDVVWGEDPPQTAANTLQVHISQLRKVLEPGVAANERVLQTRPPGYAAMIRDGQLDLHRFERLLVEGREAVLSDELELGSERLRDALETWRGPCLTGLPLQGAAQATIAGLHELRLAVYEDLIATELALGRHVAVVPTLEALIAEHPFRESLRGQLMLALYRSGRQADALEVFRLARQTLVDELGIEPGRELQRLETAILQHDTVLDATPRTSTPRPPRPSQSTEEGASERRKPVVVAVTDLLVEVDEGDALDAERLRRLRQRAVELVSTCVTRHHGVVYRVAGERAIAVFGAATAHEDDALRGVRAVAEAASALAAVATDPSRTQRVKLGLRAGIEAGVALVGRDDAGEISIDGGVLLFGERAAAVAAHGEILLGPTAQELLGDAVRIEPQADKTKRSFARLVEIVPQLPTNARHDTALVGRGRELAELQHLLSRARDERRCLLVTMLGDAGIGKSRLAAELARQSDDVRVVRGTCRAYGEGITLAPLADIVADLIGGAPDASHLAAVFPADDEADRVAHVLAGALGGEEPAAAAEEVFRAARRLLEMSGQAQPLVVVFDDLHWAEPMFLDLVEHVAEWSRETPIMLLCLARPELLEERPSWGKGSANATTLLLEPLTEGESRAMVDDVLAETDALAAETRDRIVSLAGGNPFFVEQLLAVASQEPGYAAQLSSPPTVQALLAARLDRLPESERRLLEHASVVGAEFSREILGSLLPESLAETLSRDLTRLAQRRLLTWRDAGLRHPETYAFTHALIREAAYESLPKARRFVLHRHVGDWLEDRMEQAPETDELAGYHLEQAYLCAQEVGTIGEDDLALARRAAAHLSASARRADAIGDMPKVVSLLSRAEVLLAVDDPARAAMLADLGEALRDVGELARAEVAVNAAVEAAAGRDAAAEARAVAVRWQMRLQTDPAVSFDEATTAITATIDKLTALGHVRGLAKAWISLAEVPFLRGQAAVSEEALERGLAYARTAGDRRTEAMATNFLIGAAVSGPMPVPAAIRRCGLILEQTRGEGRVAATALRALAGLSAMEGRFAEAWRYVGRDRAILRDLGLRVVASSSAMIAGLVGVLAADLARAESELRWGFETLEEIGDRNGLATVAAALADVVLAQGRLDEALTLTRLSSDAAAPEDLTIQVAWRGPQAKALARIGEQARAEELAKAAVELAEHTDFLDLHGNALLDLAEVLQLGGRSTDASSTATEAAELFERKGNLVSLARARAAATVGSLATA